MTGFLSAGTPSSSNTHERGALTVGSSTMSRHPDATSLPIESFHKLRPYLQFSPLMADPTDEVSMSPSSLGGRIIESFSVPLNSLQTAAASALRDSSCPMNTGSRQRWEPW